MAFFTEGSFAGNQIDESDSAAGVYYFYLGFTRFEHLSILVSDATNWTVTLEATNDDSSWYDVTNTLLGAATLAVGVYFPNRVIPCKNLRLVCVAGAPPNKLNIEWFIKKAGGR